MTWTTQEEATPATYELHLGSKTKEFQDEITAKDIREFARENGLKTFNVKDVNGQQLNANEAPFEEDVYIEEYNATK